MFNVTLVIAKSLLKMRQCYCQTHMTHLHIILWSYLNPHKNTTAVTVSKRALHKYLIYTQKKKCASFTHKSVLNQCLQFWHNTRAEFSSVLSVYLCYFSTWYCSIIVCWLIQIGHMIQYKFAQHNSKRTNILLNSHETNNLALFLSMKNDHHNACSFDCSTAVFLRAEMQNYKCIQFLNSQFYGGRVRY